jgi:hypothetical protein
MKQKGFKISVMAALALAFVFAAAHAQVSDAPIVIKANIPFSFMVQNMMFPAGTYNIEKVDTNTLAIYNDKMGVRLTFFADPLLADAAAPYGELVFNEYQGKDFLSKIWVQGLEYGYYIPLSDQERHMMKMGSPKTKTVKYTS